MGTLLCSLAFALLALGARADWRSRRIPNGLVALLMLVAWSDRVLALGLGAGTRTAAIAWFLAVFPWAILWAYRWMGAGDAKYFAAGAMLLPIPILWQAVVLAALLGGVLALGWPRWPPGVARPSRRDGVAAPDATIPYALPMGAAIMAIRLWSDGHP